MPLYLDVLPPTVACSVSFPPSSQLFALARQTGVKIMLHLDLPRLIVPAA